MVSGDRSTEVTSLLGCFVSSVAFEELPKRVVDASKLFFLDYLANAVGGAPHGLVRCSSGAVRSFFGLGSCSQIAVRSTLSPAGATYLNARAANALDSDDAHINFLHIGPAMVSPALALAEERQASGRSLITAIVAGYEVGARIGGAMGMPFVVDPNTGQFRATHLHGTGWKAVAAAASAAKMLDLTPDQASQALAIGAMNAPLPAMSKWRLHEERPLPLQKTNDVGWAAVGGLLAAGLAAGGATGFLDIFEGDDGFWRMNGAEHFDVGLIQDGLGANWSILDAGLKRYPACRHISTTLDLVGEIRRSHEFEVDEVESIVVGLSPMTVRPIWANVHPRNAVESEFSIPHGIAMQLLEVPRGPEWHADDRRKDPRAAALRERVQLVVLEDARQALIDQYPGLYRRLPTEVTVTLADGRTFVRAASNAFGDQWVDEFRIDFDDGLSKFEEFAGSGRRKAGLSVRQIEQVIDSTRNLEQLDDISQLMSSLRQADL